MTPHWATVVNSRGRSAALLRRCLRLLCLTLAMLITSSGCAAPQFHGAPPPTPPAGWTKLSGAHVSLWLPSSYRGVSSRGDIQQLIAKLRAAGSAYAEQADDLSRNLSHIDLIASDSAYQGSDCAPGLQVRMSDPALQPVELDQRSVQALADALKSTDGVEIESAEVVQFERFGAGRIVITNTKSCRKAMTYIVPWGRNYWYVIFSATAEEFAHYLPSFEQSIHTFLVESDPNT